MDTLVPGRIGSSSEPIDFSQVQNQFRVVKSATTLVLRPQSFARGVGLLVQLLLFKNLAQKAKQQLYAALETSGNLIMEGHRNGKMQVEEGIWRNMLETAVAKGEFSKHQVRNINAWLQYDWSTIVNSKKKSTAQWSEGAPNRLRFAETVLKHRTSRFALVLENLYDDFNQQAVVRTADCFGIQNLHVVSSPDLAIGKNTVSRGITKQVLPFMTIHNHSTTSACIQSLRDSGHEIWATDLSPGAIKLDSPELLIPPKLAVVFGRELDGCSKEILAAADRRVYIPLFGFAESLNISVAASLVMQTLFVKCPEARGNLTEGEKALLRPSWYSHLARGSVEQQQLFQTFLVNPPPPFDDLRRLDQVSFATSLTREQVMKKRTKPTPDCSATGASPQSPEQEPSAKRFKNHE